MERCIFRKLRCSSSASNKPVNRLAFLKAPSKLPKRFYEALISASLPIDKQGALHYEIKPSLPLGCSAGSKASEQTKGSPSGKDEKNAKNQKENRKPPRQRPVPELFRRYPSRGSRG